MTGGWPPIEEPELLARLSLDDAAFADFMAGLAASIGSRAYEPAVLERALRYPWARPEGSYVLRDGAVEAPGDLAVLTAGRHPLLAFGSNAAPRPLAAKLAHFPAVEDRTALVLTGELHDVDVGASASPAVYGAMPAALFPSPGTAVRAAVLWLTPAQVTQLTWSELSYRLGRLDRAGFVADDAAMTVDRPLAFVSRLGAFAPDGDAPVALAAIPARGRTAAELTQEQLLDLAAGLVLGPGARAEALVRAVFEDVAAVFARARDTLWPLGRPLAPSDWAPLPARPD